MFVSDNKCLTYFSNFSLSLLNSVTVKGVSVLQGAGLAKWVEQTPIDRGCCPQRTGLSILSQSLCCLVLIFPVSITCIFKFWLSQFSLVLNVWIWLKNNALWFQCNDSQYQFTWLHFFVCMLLSKHKVTYLPVTSLDTVVMISSKPKDVKSGQVQVDLLVDLKPKQVNYIFKISYCTVCANKDLNYCNQI